MPADPRGRGSNPLCGNNEEGKIKKSPHQPQQGVRDERRNLYEDMVVDAESLGALQH